MGLRPPSAGSGSGVILPWAATTQYKAGQPVTYQGQVYTANADFTSGASFNAANWTALPRAPRVNSSVASSATPTINVDLYDVVKLTAQAVNITGVTLAGTPVDEQTFKLVVVATGTVTVAWGASFGNGSATLPASFAAGTTTVAFRYDAAAAKALCQYAG
jgi:hypothetical protein